MLYIKKKMDRSERTTRVCMSWVMDLERYAGTCGHMDFQEDQSERRLSRVPRSLTTLSNKLPDSIFLTDWEPKVLMRRCPVQQSFGSLPEDSEMQNGRWLKSASFSWTKACSLRRIWRRRTETVDRSCDQQLIKEARDDVKSAYFVGGRRFIEGIEVTGWEDQTEKGHIFNTFSRFSEFQVPLLHCMVR